MARRPLHQPSSRTSDVGRLFDLYNTTQYAIDNGLYYTRFIARLVAENRYFGIPRQMSVSTRTAFAPKIPAMSASL
jgi:hypothetical protein